MIFDCGEGTYGQLVRHFGVDRTTEILARTNIIFVSHVHADHHLGLISLVKNRDKAVLNVDNPVKKVIVLGPKTMHFWLKNYQNLFENIFDGMEFIECQYLVSTVLVILKLVNFVVKIIRMEFGRKVNSTFH